VILDVSQNSHIYMQILHLFPELIALPSNAIHIKCYDFNGPINSGYEFCFMLYKTNFVMAMVLASSNISFLSYSAVLQMLL
jgi:hypothetical protein